MHQSKNVIYSFIKTDQQETDHNSEGSGFYILGATYEKALSWMVLKLLLF